MFTHNSCCLFFITTFTIYLNTHFIIYDVLSFSTMYAFLFEKTGNQDNTNFASLQYIKIPLQYIPLTCTVLVRTPYVIDHQYVTMSDNLNVSWRSVVDTRRVKQSSNFIGCSPRLAHWMLDPAKQFSLLHFFMMSKLETKKFHKYFETQFFEFQKIFLNIYSFANFRKILDLKIFSSI